MKKIMILGAIITVGAGIYLGGQEVDGRDKTISIVEENHTIDDVSGKITRVLEGEESVYYRYEYPSEVIEKNFVMEDMVDDFYEKVLDYEKAEGQEYLVVADNTGSGIVVHKGIDEICLTMVGENNINSVEKALVKNNFIDKSISAKIEKLEEELIRI